MQIVNLHEMSKPLGDNLLEMSKPMFREKEEKFYLLIVHCNGPEGGGG